MRASTTFLTRLYAVLLASPSSVASRRGRRTQLWLRLLLAGMLLLTVLPAFGLPGMGMPRAHAAGICDIACENAKSGSPPSQWDISTHNAGSASIQGFATDISVNVGSAISFKINTASTNYNLTIYRMGYYQGNGARQIAVVTPTVPLPQTQPACLTDSKTGLIDCGNWAVSASWTVPSDAVSGIYFAKVVDANTGAASHIPFVVRNDASTSAIAFRTDDTTWEAYNDYGGNSLYYGNAPTGCGANGQYSCGRAYKVSYNRPFNDRSEGSGYGTSNYFFYAEYPMVRWLERNGYDVSYISTVDLDRNPGLLLSHKVILSAGHDEYWSAAERAALTSARDHGVNIAAFTGNTGFWKTRWENSIDGSNTAYRTLVTYKETLDNKVEDPKDPPTWTGSWRDPRFSPPADGGQPENALLGTVFTVNSGSAPPVISAAFSKLRFWRNTAVTALTGNQTATLGAQTIGYEWDQDLDNGFRPAGLVDMAATTVNVSQLIEDYGSTYGPGTAIWAPTLYRAPSGALVFSAGTVQWAWGLDTNHDTLPDTGPSSPDPTMQQATVNVLADLGAQPATLQSGLVATTASTDTTAPTSTITSPAQNATVQGGTITIMGTASDTGGGVVAGIEVSIDGGSTWHKATLAAAAGTVTWSYSTDLDSVGSVTIKSRAVDDSGNLEAPSTGTTVTVMCPCRLGYTTIGSLTDSNDSNNLNGSRFTTGNGGTIGSMSVYVGAVGSAPNNQYQLGIYTDNNGLPGSLVAHSASGTLTANAWNTLPVSANLNPNTAYWLVYNTNGNSANLNAMQYDSPAGNVPEMFSTSTVSFGTWPSTITAATQPSFGFSIYATYSAPAGTPTSSPTAALTTATPTSTGTPAATATNTPTATGTPATPAATATATATNTPPATATNTPTATATNTPPATATPTVTGSSIFTASATPAASANDGNATELGVKFRSDVSGYVNGIRFYKVSGDTGTHSGSLWSSSGQLLASATFSNETSSGWQQVVFSTPISITAGTLYVASYHSNVGLYAYTSNAFANAVDNGVLHAPASASVNGNGVFAYGATQFPTQSYNATNYWVDVVFNASGASGTATATPTVTNTSVPTATGIPATPTSTATATNTPTPTATATATNTPMPTATNTPPATATPTVTGSSIFTASATPAASSNDGSATELGVKFRSDVSGYVNGIRFYKVSGDTGTHSGSLWSSSGQLLASATFSNETSSGWQQVVFSTPISITAGTLYVASYHSNVGLYAYTSNAFANAVDNGVLHAPASASVNGNGVFAYGATQFPTQSYNATNYWVDVVFNPTYIDPVPPSVVSTSPGVNATGVSTSTVVAAAFNKSVVSSSIQFTLTGPNNQPVAGALSYNDANYTASFQPAAALAANTTYTATVSGVTDHSGNTLASPYTWSFTTIGASFSCPCNLFSAAATPAVVTVQDPSAVEVGMKFTSDTNGYIKGIRFYKGPNNTGTHSGNLWSSTGQLLATITFSNETASGWQQATFAQPVAITAGTTYVASYHTNVGFYSASSGYFASSVDNAPLHGVANSTAANGVYAYGASQFPTQSYNATNYWVDVVFNLN